MAEILPAGVYCRNSSKKLYFEMRIPEGKLYSAKIKSAEEGGLCYDIARRYMEGYFAELARNGASGGDRGKRKLHLELNYPDYSPSLVLEDLPGGFSILRNTEGAMMKIILRQAQAAAKNLPKQAQAAAKHRAKVQKHSVEDVGGQIIDSRRSQQQNDCNSLRRCTRDHQGVAAVYGGCDFQKLFKDIEEHIIQCKHEYNLKVNERKELQRKVEDIKKDLGLINIPKSGPDKFHEHMECFKQLVGRDGKVSLELEAFEQEYKAEESKCFEFRKILEDHNSKTVFEDLLLAGNRMTGRQRTNEKERLPSVQEVIPIEEQSMPPPTSPLEHDVVSSGEMGIAMPSFVETDEYDLDEFWSSVANYSTHTDYLRENEDGSSSVFWCNSNAEVQAYDAFILNNHVNSIPFQ